MLWGVISDIHSNLEALEASIKTLSEQGAKGWICCGDIVGYGPQPNEVCEKIASLKPLHVVSGNHDLAVVGKMDVSWFNDYAQAAALWTRDSLTEPARKFLEALPARDVADTFMVVHGSPRNPPEEYLLTRQQYMDNLAGVKVSPCFVGHSHLTWCFQRDPNSPLGTKAQLLRDGQRVDVSESSGSVVNPGSVGQPRDHDNRASCGLYDDKARTFKLFRVPYDIASVQKKMRDVALPELLVLRLSYGQ
ncbi:MAG: metallophosphoesterase family protein [Elusimicrobia bacterium]|nr:metallophosphoesterase family protein [Elusimicrobiota bacterium]